eukprot:scaffold1010_cov117-Skeletonema_dohrnii-CCMP3373.AAC.1
MISCVRCSILLLLGVTSYCCSALSPLLTTTTPTKSILTKHNNNPKTKLNLSSSGSSFYPPEPPQQKQQTPTQQRWAEYTTTTTPSTPTQIQQHHPPQDQIPPTPKLVLFGATGKIGRRILKKLLSAPLDIEIVAFVRSQSRLEEVLYHEEDLVLGNLIDKEKKSGAKLTVVVGDVVADTDVYRGKFETERETEVLDEWVARAQDFFRVKGWTNNNSNNNSTNGASISGGAINSLQEEDQINEDVRIIEAGDEALQEAVSGATIIISCLSSLRYSNLWTDYVKVPLLRVFRQDASKWCVDNTHPYYIHYLSTKKILEVAEREQVKRDAYNEFERERLLLEEQIQRGRKMIMDGDEEEEGFESEIAAGLRKKRGTRQRQQHLVAGEDAVDLPKYGITPSSTDRIKFIRISHSMVGRNPFRLVSILTNVLRSQVTRFEFLGEQLLEKSRLVDTIILRPGEVTDIERDSNSTSLQLCIDGDVPSPNLGLVGRDDIADLAVVAALTKTSLDDDDLSFSTATTTNNATDDSTRVASTDNISNRPHHYTWSLRWTGGNGSESSALCFVKAIKNEMKLSRIRKMKEKKLTQYHLGAQLLSIRRWIRRTRPHALSVALTVYVALGATAWYFFGSTILDLALRARRHNLLQRFLPL